MIVYCLGPAGTSSYDAALELFPKESLHLFKNFDALFNALKKNSATGFVPIENSLHGSIDEVLDLLIEFEMKIWKTFDVSIHYALGALDKKKISKVASHPQALAHCRKFLRKNYPNVEYFPVNSTAFAVEMALKDESTAAIGRLNTLKKLKLPVLFNEIQGKGNTTRFAVVSKKDPYPKSKKTQMSIALHPTDDHPGLLHKLLTPFKVYDVNLTRIESRPSGGKFGEYIFFVDFIGTQKEPRTKKVFEELKRLADIQIVGEW
ncbi:hypothetical protein A3A67_00085 [Candidatus Peribacteria bacterium RIFCSPLOWO2_01_FULL_51_18]|nr:MAG: hypothetical protein A3A67_00085 [Candidatus Peribacteria bacterium RIFCSPLOWO2_01_FULL_51_18]